LTFPSPCKDTGDSTAVTERYDFEGDPRIAYGNVDIKFVGLPGTAPVGLCIGTGVLDPPIPSM
jgi:hypothetical protein